MVAGDRLRAGRQLGQEGGQAARAEVVEPRPPWFDRDAHLLFVRRPDVAFEGCVRVRVQRLVRTPWNRGSTALWCRGRAQHALLSAARAAQRAGRSWRLPGGRPSASKRPVSYASTTAWTRSRRLSFCRMCVMCVLTVVSLM